jgi:CRP/FNR family transcriptional regulator
MDTKAFKKATLFQNLSDADLKVISSACETRMHHQGDLLFSQGDAAKFLYIVHHGSVRIHQDDKRGENTTVAVLASGMVFGEMGLVNADKRSATGEVVENSQVTHISYEKLEKIFAVSPATAANFFRALSKVLAQRLSQTTGELSFTKAKRAS